MSKHLTLLALATLIELSLSAQAHAQAAAPPVRTVALSGRPALGAPSGLNYDSFTATSYFSPVLNDTGRTAFFSTLIESGMAVASGTGIWSEGGGSLSLLARTDAPAPGTPTGVNFRDFINSPLVLNNAGQIAFFAGLTGSGVDITNEQSVWSDASGSLALAARDRNAAPGAPAGAFFSGLSRESLVGNQLGQIAFVSYLGGTGVNNDNNRGVWSSGSGSLSLIARAETHAPGTPDGVRYSTFGGTLINDAGQVAFGAGIAGPGVSHLMDEATDIGIWSQGTGSLALVARAGSQAPGAPNGVMFREFRQTAFNNAGHIAFDATLRGSDVDSSNSSGIWSQSSGSMALVARAGSPAPGAASGVNYSTFNTLLLNNVGQVAFSATLDGDGMDPTKNAGIWSDVSGSLAPLALNGQPAPGTPPGVNFGAPVSGPHFGGALNSAGQIAFAASLTGSGVDSMNDRGIWATDHTGALQLIARTGDLLEVAPANFRTIRELYFVAGASNSDGRPSGFNNSGQLAFWARFTDGSEGVFVSNRVIIAEPASVALLALGLPLLTGRRTLCKAERSIS